MVEILSYIMVIGVCAYVMVPLFVEKKTPDSKSVSGNIQLEEWLSRKRLIEDTINDLTFDLQTGKLSAQDHKELLQEQGKMLDAINRKFERAHGGKQVPGKAGGKYQTALEAQACPGCGHEVGRTDKFCSNCGEKLR